MTYPGKTTIAGWPEVFLVLWQGRRFILAALLLSTIASTLFHISKTPVYVTRLGYDYAHLPVMYGWERVSNDFQAQFLTQDTFEKWKAKNKTTNVSFDEFSNFQSFGQLQFLKMHEESKVRFEANKIDGAVALYTNDLRLIGEAHSYMTFVNEVLTSKYAEEVKREIEIELKVNKISVSEVLKHIEREVSTKANEESLVFLPIAINDAFVSRVVNYERYLSFIKHGTQVLNIRSPETPKLVGLTLRTSIGWSIIFGLFVGACFVMLRFLLPQKNEPQKPPKLNSE